MWRHAIWIAALLGSCFIAYNVTASHNPAVSGPRQSIAARTTPNNTANSAPVNPAPNDNVAVNISVDYGAQMLLLDAQSRRTGYDRNTGQVLSNLPEAAYVDDSISDAADDSD